jgi:ATP-dependent Clp protease protease subunit
MPIGVPRIIYCWGEELPPQWTDIYNFIFRRRMVFLMQYLDDELCNQICGLLINIHMEDRTKELEKKEIEKSGIFKSKSTKESGPNQPSQASSQLTKKDKQFLDLNAGDSKKLKKDKSMEDLLSSYGNSLGEEDLAIDENYRLEQYTLQKITLEWLNWNAQFFDYSDEPYLYYLAEILSKDFNKEGTGQLFYFNIKTNKKNQLGSALGNLNTMHIRPTLAAKTISGSMLRMEVYSPLTLNLANLISKDKTFSINHLLPDLLVFLAPNRFITNSDLVDLGAAVSSDFGKKTNQLAGLRHKGNKELLSQFKQLIQKPGLNKLLGILASKEFLNKSLNPQKLQSVGKKALGQRNLRKEYALDNAYSLQKQQKKKKALNYLDFDSTGVTYKGGNLKGLAAGTRKQTRKALQEEETKKVFVMINSFGGSVGNGITVHDALQFIKAGSLTLGLGVAASAASLVLAGGTISERYVTEGCHTMIHQPESSLSGQASDIWIDSQEIMKIRLDVAEIYSLSAHRPRHKILRDLDRDFYLTATETIHYGLADEIATNEVMHEIIEMTSKVWDYHDSKQQRLLETRNSANAVDTQTQS